MVWAIYDEKAKMCYINTDSFIVYIKTSDIYKDIAKDVETKFDTSNYKLDWPFLKEKNKKVNGLIEDELCGKIKKEFVGLRAKTNSYLRDDGKEDEKAKGTKKCLIEKT